MQVLSKHQQGISLLELMVSLSIGILLLLGLGFIYQVANQANRDNDTLSMNAEVARSVFNRLEYDLKRAGFVDLYDNPQTAFVPASGLNCPTSSFVEGKDPWNNHYKYGAVLGNKKNTDVGTIYLRWQPESVTPGASLTELDKNFMSPISYISCGNMRPVYGCDNNKISDSGSNKGPGINNYSNCSSTDSLSSEIEIAYQVARANTPNPLLSGLPASGEDCTFTDLNTSVTNGFAINRYFLSSDSKNNGELSFSCQGNASKKIKVLVPGVQEMVIRYITTVPEKDSSKTLIESESGNVVTAYKNAQEVENAPLGWAGVVGVEVCLVIGDSLSDGHDNKSLANVQGKNRPTCRRNSDGKFSTDVEKEKENRFYERYVRTFSLPNSLYSPNK